MVGKKTDFFLQFEKTNSQLNLETNPSIRKGIAVEKSSAIFIDNKHGAHLNGDFDKGKNHNNNKSKEKKETSLYNHNNKTNNNQIENKHK